MAVATSMAVMGGLGLAKGIYDTASAAKRQKQAQAELDAYQRQELTNAYKDMQISTIGSDAMRDESSRNIATAMNTIGNAGTRAIIGATPKIVAEQNNTNLAIQRELDDQVQKRNYAIAQDDAQIRGMQEQREYQDLAGLGNAIDTARQDKNMGMNTALNGVMSVASTMKGQIGKDPENPYDKGIKPVSTITPIGMQSPTFPKYQLPSTVGMQPQSIFDINGYMNSLKPVRF